MEGQTAQAFAHIREGPARDVVTPDGSVDVVSVGEDWNLLDEGVAVTRYEGRCTDAAEQARVSRAAWAACAVTPPSDEEVAG